MKLQDAIGNIFDTEFAYVFDNVNANIYYESQLCWAELPGLLNEVK